MRRSSKACMRVGCGPSVTLIKRVWWAPWRVRALAVCWVCRAPLLPTEAAEANRRWAWPQEWTPKANRSRRFGDPQHPCREMPTRGCPSSYDGVCGDRPCARFESDDPTPWERSAK